MRHRLTVTLVAAGLGVAVLASPPGERSAFAQPSPEARAAASALFDDGRRLMSENKFAEACPKLEESQRIDPGAGTLYQLSVCFESIGRIASAWIGFRDVAVQSANAGQADREKIARAKAAALEPKLTRIKISAPAGAGIEVKRDGAVVSPALWGTPVPLDPGAHKVSASAPNKEPWEVTVQLDQPGTIVNVDVPPLQDKKGGVREPPPPPPAGDRTPPDTSPSAQPPPIEGTPSPRAWQMPLGIAATALGAVGLGVGTAFGFMAKSSYDQSNQPVAMGGGGCSSTTNVCSSQTGLNQRSDAVTKGNVGTGVFIAGAVLAAGGIVIWATAPSSHASRSASAPPKPGPEARPSMQVAVVPTGVALRGGW